MFIQVIEGKTNDAGGLHKRLELWERDLMPGAIGYLGSTGGCTSTGDCIMIARFESRDAAQRNSDRPEQSAWWSETSKLFTGEVTFHNCGEVLSYLRGGSDDAGFVQIIQGRVSDPARFREMYLSLIHI